MSNSQNDKKSINKISYCITSVIVCIITTIFVILNFKPSDDDKSDNNNYTSSYTLEKQTESQSDTPVELKTYRFRNKKLLENHYDKHGKEMGFKSEAQYEKAASDVINNPASLRKVEEEDGDYVFYLEATNELVILSTDGYIRTYFKPNDGIEYFNRT